MDMNNFVDVKLLNEFEKKKQSAIPDSCYSGFLLFRIPAIPDSCYSGFELSSDLITCPDLSGSEVCSCGFQIRKYTKFGFKIRMSLYFKSE
jgi:hypothetical protein